jgi:phytoene desaturase
VADYDVAVIGAGLGGLSAGAQLAKTGRRVVVLEQSDLVGGCCSTFEQQGFRFDLGASIIEAADEIDYAFQRLGSSLAAEVELVPVDPVYSVIMKDGTKLTLPMSSEGTAEAIAKLAPGDEQGWHAYFDYMSRFLDAAFSGGFFRSPANTLADFADLMKRSPDLLKFGSLFVRSYQGVVNKFFHDERIREAHGFQSYYAGLPPELAPGHMALLSALERRGVFYTRGGMGAIPEALQLLGERFGMTVRLNTCVDQVMLNGRRVAGVVLTDGTQITADLVVSDVNAKTLYLGLIGEENLPWLQRTGIKSYEVSMSTPMIYLGVDYEPPLESHHTLCTLPMEELNEYWWKTYKRGAFPADQFGIISWTSASDASLAPPGHHTICLTLAPGPYRLRGAGWDKMKPTLLERVIQQYSKRYIPGLAEHVKVAEFATPLDFERRLLSPEGAIYALRQDLANITVFRPSSKSKAIDGLYLVGASTGGGGGVPSTILSGVAAVDLIDKYEA